MTKRRFIGIILKVFIIITLTSCGVHKQDNSVETQNDYIIQEITRTKNSIDPEISYYYISNIDSITNQNAQINLVFDCDLQIAACCRDTELNQKGKDLKVDTYFYLKDDKCVNPDIFKKGNPININLSNGNFESELKIFKVEIETCKCHGKYTNRSKKYRDSIYIYPYKLKFLKISKEEEKIIKRNFKGIG